MEGSTSGTEGGRGEREGKEGREAGSERGREGPLCPMRVWAWPGARREEFLAGSSSVDGTWGDQLDAFSAVGVGRVRQCDEVHGFVCIGYLLRQQRPEAESLEVSLPRQAPSRSRWRNHDVWHPSINHSGNPCETREPDSVWATNAPETDKQANFL